MIGSSTILVKRNNRFHVFIDSNYFDLDIARYCRKQKISFFDFWKKIIRGVKKYDKTDLNKEEISKIVNSTNCISEENLGYHELCGDMYRLIDMDKKEVFSPKFLNGREWSGIWERITNNSILESYKKFNQS